MNETETEPDVLSKRLQPKFFSPVHTGRYKNTTGVLWEIEDPIDGLDPKRVILPHHGVAFLTYRDTQHYFDYSWCVENSKSPSLELWPKIVLLDKRSINSAEYLSKALAEVKSVLNQRVCPLHVWHNPEPFSATIDDNQAYLRASQMRMGIVLGGRTLDFFGWCPCPCVPMNLVPPHYRVNWPAGDNGIHWGGVE